MWRRLGAVATVLAVVASTIAIGVVAETTTASALSSGTFTGLASFATLLWAAVLLAAGAALVVLARRNTDRH